jgi:hypothetical protein
MKFCSDCKHYREQLSGQWCYHPSLGVRIVDGTSNRKYCVTMRHEHGDCGPNAKLHEEKTSATIIPFWKKLFKLKG